MAEQPLILVDTSVWIDYFNGYASVEADFLTLCIAEARPIVLPGPVITETLQGVRETTRAARIADVLSAFELAPELERGDYEEAAAIYRTCRARGSTPRSTIDCLVAQLCLRHGYELLTRDRDFEAIARFFPLKRVSPDPGVRELAGAYYPPGTVFNRQRASAPRRSPRA